MTEKESPGYQGKVAISKAPDVLRNCTCTQTLTPSHTVDRTRDIRFFLAPTLLFLRQSAGGSSISLRSAAAVLLRIPGSHKRGVCNANYLETP